APRRRHPAFRRGRQAPVCAALCSVVQLRSWWSRGSRGAGTGAVFVDDDLEAFEMRAGKVLDLAAVFTGLGMGGTELIGLRPGFEMFDGFPDRMGGVEGMILGLRTLQHVKLDIAGHFRKA